MLSLSIKYRNSSVLLEIEGLPDYSKGHQEGIIGIISSWKLDLVGSALLEGKREHLEAMISTVLPYARYVVSGSPKQFGSESSPVTILPFALGHKIILKSSRAEVKPLSIEIDDAELVDLVRCLDEVRLDNRIQIDWDCPQDLPLQTRELNDRVSLKQKIAAPVFGLLSVLSLSIMSLLIPIEQQPSIDQSLEQKELEAEDLPKKVD